jgi:hypothetical protein
VAARQPIAQDRPFTVVLDDDSLVEGRLGRVDAGPTWAKHRVSIELDRADLDADTSGHLFDPCRLGINLRFDDDAETHPLGLRFPTPWSADAFRTRLLHDGALAGALVAGVTTEQLSAAPTPPADRDEPRPGPC